MTIESTPRWEHFQHVADIGVRGFGRTLAEAFEQAALAMTAVMVEPSEVRPARSIDVMVAAEDEEMLLVEWLDALIYEMATRRMLFCRYQVKIEDRCLRGRAWGESIDVARHQPGVEVKGATLTELRVWHDPHGVWRAQCVVDV